MRLLLPFVYFLSFFSHELEDSLVQFIPYPLNPRLQLQLVRILPLPLGLVLAAAAHGVGASSVLALLRSLFFLHGVARGLARYIWCVRSWSRSRAELAIGTWGSLLEGAAGSVCCCGNVWGGQAEWWLIYAWGVGVLGHLRRWFLLLILRHFISLILCQITILFLFWWLI